MREQRKITPKKIKEVKKFLKEYTIRSAAIKAKVSYKTTWHIAHGHYDSSDPLPVKTDFVILHF